MLLIFSPQKWMTQKFIKGTININHHLEWHFHYQLILNTRVRKIDLWFLMKVEFEN